MRIGTGWDLHRLIKNRPLMIGGIHVPCHKGEDAHSDGDVLIHAIIDAVLGAAALGDIGTHFPPSDTQYKNVSSLVLLEKTAELLKNSGFQLTNLDTTVILQAPNLSAHIDKIRDTLAGIMGISREMISVKAKTGEGVDAVGRGEAIAAMASVLIEETDNSEWV